MEKVRRTRTMEAGVDGCKRLTTAIVEQTELTRMEELVGKIVSFALKSEQLSEELAALAASHTQLSATFAATDEHWKNCEQQVSGCEEQVALAKLKLHRLERTVDGSIVQRLVEQSEQLQHAEDAIRGFAVKTSSSEAAQRALSAKFHSVASVLAAQVKTQGENFQVLQALCFAPRDPGELTCW